MTVSVDSIEDNIAVLEFDSRVRVKIPASELPPNTREGDCFTLDEEGGLTPDAEEAKRRRKRNIDLFNSLMKK